MKLIALASLAFLTACGNNTFKHLKVKGTGPTTIVVVGVSDPAKLKAQANDLGLSITGDMILKISGKAELISSLEVNKEAFSAQDEVVLRSHESPFKPHPGSQYLAKKDFGILEFWQSMPQADGRGVIVGVFDDGISPHQSGFMLTTTGERKFLKRGSNSSFSTFDISQDGSGVIQEDKFSYDSQVDLNGDGKFINFSAKVTDKICLDLNLDANFSPEECKGSFSVSGEYFILPNTTLALVAEYDATTKKLKLSQPELAGDSHGEGVASVMAAHNEGNIPGLDGVAPGAKIVDYDLSEKSDIASETDYTMGNILMGLEWLAKNGAEVGNISYSLFFSSVDSQDFMSRAIDSLVKKYNIVLSFSAGNNGPGLGSLNRKAIYPDSVLVAGAFVSKELDESVWGVTGLPEEGRVVYYSSRGPGPLGDHGPTLISPLSSLTHSSPNEGYRAFNGTSSASPALAGAAAVLISAIKLQGLKVDAATVVQSMRLSGKRLKGEPFIAQGYGLPQIPAALEIYKKLIAGKEFMNVTIKANRGTVDGINARGVLLLTSQSSEVESVRIDLEGVVSPIAPQETRMNLLKLITLEYSNGIKGANDLWVSASASRFYAEVDIAQVLAGTQGEGFGEIKIKNSQTGELMAIVPVTVLDDRLATKPRRARLTVGPQGSARLSMNVPEGLRAVKIKSRLLEGDGSGLSLSIFDSNRVRTQQASLADEIWLPIERSGHHQVAISMNGGTGREAVVEIELQPLNIHLQTSATPALKPALILNSSSMEALYAKLELVPVVQPLKSMISEIGGEVKALELTQVINKKSTYKVTMAPQNTADISFFYANCSGKVTDSEGKIKLIGDSYESEDEKEKTMSFRCMSFDQGIANTHKLGWVMNLVEEIEPIETQDVAIGMRSKKVISFKEAPVGLYEVWMKHPLAGQRVKLGEVSLK